MALAQGGGGDFSILPPDLLEEIVACLPLIDRCRLRAASRWWRDGFPDTARLDHEANRRLFRPDGDGDKALWLMAPVGRGNRHAFHDACSPTRRFRATHLPPIRFIAGTSPGGWVLHVDDYGDLHALNILTGEHLRPPPVTAFRGITRIDRDARGRVTGYECRNTANRDEDGKRYEEFVPYEPYIVHSYYIQALIFFPEANSSTGDRGRFLVVVIHGIIHEISYAWEGDEHWTDGWPRLDHIWFIGLLPRRGLIYALIDSGNVVSFDPCHPTDPGFRFCDAKFRGRSGVEKKRAPFTYQYLVEISSQLWLVSRSTDYVKEKGRRRFLETDEVVLHRLDEAANIWVEVEELGEDVVLFLGVNQPLVLSARDYPQLEPGCIYFTDNTWEEHCYIKGRPVGNVGVFDTKNKTFKTDYHWSRGGCPWAAWVLL